jgi:cytochrome c oxidase cbb3-type subunit 2
MNKLPLLFAGIFITFLSAWLGLVAAPMIQFGALKPHVDEETNDVFPPPRSGLAEEGRKVYVKNGCIYCHSQQIRPEHAGSDLARGWGSRRSVPRDYINDKPHLLGSMRTGPDLTNAGKRLSNREWHHKHLFAPQAQYQYSIMPSFSFLYEVRKIKGEPSPEALVFKPSEVKIPEGHEIVPTYEAKALVEYLLSLNSDYSLPEAPVD